jgi:hypothetical protein
MLIVIILSNDTYHWYTYRTLPAYHRHHDEAGHLRALGRRVQELRKDRKFTQEGLAERFDLTHNYWQGRGES